MGRHRTSGFPVVENGPEHHPEHTDEYHQTDDQHQRVQVINLPCDAGGWSLEVVLALGGDALCRKQRTRGDKNATAKNSCPDPRT